jgi:hypothetical protein
MPCEDWADQAARQGGVIARAQLIEFGVRERTIDRMVERGELDQVAENALLVRGAPWDLQARLWTAHLSMRGVIGFDSAGQLWRVRDDEPARVHLCIEHPRRSRAPEWVTLHRVAVASWAIRRLDGLPVTSREWTVLDLAGMAHSFSAATELLDRGLQRGWLTASDVEQRVQRFPGRHGNGHLRRALPQLADGAAARSERLLHRLLRHAGITGWVANYPVWHDGQLVAIVDVAIPQARLAVEVDGWAYHSDVTRFRRDRHRQNALGARVDRAAVHVGGS